MFVTIDRYNGIHTIKCDEADARCGYAFCTERQALKRFRIEFGLQRKHFTIIRLYEQ